MSEDSPFKIGVIVMPMGPEPKPDAFGILDRDGKSVGWLSFNQVETAMAEWNRLTEARQSALSKGRNPE